MVHLIDDGSGILELTRERLEAFGVESFSGLAISPGDIVIIAGGSVVAPPSGVCVFRVPIGDDPDESMRALRASTEQPGATLAVGKAGAINAALLALRVLASRGDGGLARKLEAFAADQREGVLSSDDPTI